MMAEHARCRLSHVLRRGCVDKRGERDRLGKEAYGPGCVPEVTSKAALLPHAARRRSARRLPHTIVGSIATATKSATTTTTTNRAAMTAAPRRQGPSHLQQRSPVLVACGIVLGQIHFPTDPSTRPS
jgi:hypothetical protein